MGKKHKQGNRTKNNARPSSSSHSAELLGNSIPTFFGFSGVKDGVLPGFSTEEVHYTVDSNFQIVLKKMNKKDSTTKLKALQEFTELCKKSEEDAVKTILPFWPRLYCLLCTDIEHRVREASHHAHRAVISRIKRSLAPYLKQLAGPWFTSQYDTYPPAANAATLAFNEAFSPSKLNEAIVFCKEEILGYIYDNLTKQTPQTLSNPKTTSAEEMEAKYHRVVIASLQGFSLFLHRLSSDQIQQTEENIKKLISSSRFWRYAKHEASLIRNSFFNVLISLCQNAKFLLVGESSHMGAAIFNNLDESDPMVLPTVWDAALSTLLAIEDCWSHINLEKQVFPKLCVILRDGGRGNAVKIFPNILPLLSKMPSELIKDNNIFYNNLFENMRLGLDAQPVNQSLSEGKVVANTYVECLRYIIMIHSSDLEFCQSLISNHLIRALETQLLALNSFHRSVTAPFMSQASSLLRYWHRNKAAEDLKYEPILRYFWETLTTVFKKLVEGEVSETSKCNVMKNQVEFLLILQNPNKYVTKNKGKVKFVEDKTCEPEENETAKTENDDPGFADELLELFVKKVVLIYFNFAIQEEAHIYLPFLNKIITSFDSKKIFEEMVAVQNETKLFTLFTSFFSNWLKSDKMRVPEVVELSFNLLQNVTQEEKDIILKEIGQISFDNSLLHTVCQALLSYSSDDSVRKWIQSAQFTESLVDLTERFVEGRTDHAMSRDVITMFFKATHDDGELLIGPDAASLIMEKVSKHIWPSRTHVNELGQDLALQSKLEEGSCREAYENLVKSLFLLSCTSKEDDKLTRACETGLQAIVIHACNTNSGFKFTRQLAQVVSSLTSGDDMDFSMDRIISKFNSYIELIIGSDFSDNCASNSDIEEALGIIKMLLEDADAIVVWRQLIEKCSLFGYNSKGTWDMKYIELCESEPVIFHDVTISNYKDKLNQMCDQLIGCCADNMSSKCKDFPEDILQLITKYRRYFKHFTVEASKKVLTDSVVIVDVRCHQLTKFAKWTLFTGSLLNLTVSAHPRCYKTAILLDEQCPYYTNNEQLAAFYEKYPDADLTPIQITEEERKELEEELKVTEDVFPEVDYDEQNNIIPISNQIFDFVYSVGILESFSRSYTNTQYFHSLRDPLKKLKAVAEELFKNMNLVEHMFCYYSCRHFVSTEPEWRMILPTLKEIFHRNFLEEKFDLDKTDVELFIEHAVVTRCIDENSIMKLCGVVENYSLFVTEEQWDVIFIYVDVMLESITSKLRDCNIEMACISVASRLCSQLMKTFRENHLRPMEERLPPEACVAWNEVVLSEMWNKLFSIWRTIAGTWHNVNTVLPENLIVFENLSDAVGSEIGVTRGNEFSNVVPLTRELARYVASSHAAFQVTSFRLLTSLVPDLVLLEVQMFRDNISKMSQESKEGTFFKKTWNCDWICKGLEKQIAHHQGIVETLLSDFVVGDCCTVEPFTDSYSYTYSYLLLWWFLLEMCGGAHAPLRFQYACWLRDEGFSATLLESVFKLMPQTVLHGSETKENCQKYFEVQPPLDLKGPVTSERIEHIACFVYRVFLERLPNVTREWWNQAENKTSALVDKVTSLYVSPLLIANELKNVQQDRETVFDNMEIKTYPAVREVVATYTIDEVKVDLMMTLPLNHPLGTIKIESSKAVAISSNWRNWLFHITKYLIHQNGTIWDALVLWKSNLDKKFEGVEECYICFSILQGSTFEIPKLSCQTCKKKFHSNCMYKWVSTSNKSTCPICRNMF